MCGYGLDRDGSEYGQMGCAVMDWIELVKYNDRWDVRIGIGSM